VLRKEFGSLLVRARWSSRSRISTVASGIAAASQKRVSRSPPVRSRALNLVFARSLLSTRRSTCQRCCFARTAGRGALLHLGEQQPSCGPISSLLRTTSERASRAPRHCCYARHATVPTGSDFAPAPMGERHSEWEPARVLQSRERRSAQARRPRASVSSRTGVRDCCRFDSAIGPIAGVGRQAALSVERDDDLAGGAALLDVRERVECLVERERLVDERAEVAGVVEGGQLAQLPAVGLHEQKRVAHA
jgi:hypothetical protein